LKFKELGGERNKTGCSLIAHEASPCQLISLTLNPVKSDEGTILASVNGHYIVVNIGVTHLSVFSLRLIAATN
jgi:hypothetical protein